MKIPHYNTSKLVCYKKIMEAAMEAADYEDST